MKIGFVGNMNNNNFALMRYFRDLGADAHLLLYSNDGRGSLSHFTPESDTWEIAKWSPYIHQTDIPNAPVAAFDFPASWFMGCRSMFRAKLGMQQTWVPSVSRAQVRRAYRGYDSLVGSGITPATLLRAGRNLDIFYPYASQVEYLYTGEFVRQFPTANRLTKRLLKSVQLRQAQGIRSAANTINSEPGITQDALKSIGVSAVKLGIPMVYARERSPDAPPNELLARLAGVVSASPVSILHHARLMWKNDGRYTEGQWRLENKNTAWLLRAFAKLRSLRPLAQARLLIVEYGPDVAPTKELVVQLGVADQVVWLPKMQRRELMWLLSRVTIAAGEFYDVPRMMWGGTGWEALASGKPLLQGFHFALGEFDGIFGHPPPPMLPVRTEHDILQHLLRVADDASFSNEIGAGAKAWFETYSGAGLAKRWLDILQKSVNAAPALDVPRLAPSANA